MDHRRAASCRGSPAASRSQTTAETSHIRSADHSPSHSHAFFFDYIRHILSRVAPLICGTVTTRQSGLHAATHFSFDPNENEWPSRRAAAQFSVLYEQRLDPVTPG